MDVLVEIRHMQTIDDEITDDQIRALMGEAGAAGDEAQVAICRAALDGDESARAKCAEVIIDACYIDLTPEQVREWAETGAITGVFE